MKTLQTFFSRITLVVGLSFLLVCFLPGCCEEVREEQKTSVVNHSKQEEFKIIVKTRLVVKHYGNWVTEGEWGFRYDYATKGYGITVMKGDQVFSNQYCPEDMLDHYLDLIKYKLSIRDSLIEPGKKSN